MWDVGGEATGYPAVRGWREAAWLILGCLLHVTEPIARPCGRGRWLYCKLESIWFTSVLSYICIPYVPILSRPLLRRSIVWLLVILLGEAKSKTWYQKSHGLHEGKTEFLTGIINYLWGSFSLYVPSHKVSPSDLSNSAEQPLSTVSFWGLVAGMLCLCVWETTVSLP